MGNDGGLTAIEMGIGTLYMNPLYKKHEGRKGGKGRKRKRLSVLNKTLGTECSLRTTCIFLFLVTALFVAVLPSVYFGKNFVMVLTLPLKVHENSTSGFNFTNIQREASVDGYVKCHIDGEKIVCLPKRVVEENITELPCSP